MSQEPTDALFDLALTVMFILIGLMNVMTYVRWTNNNVFNDVARDKVKAASTYTEPKLDEYTLTAEEVMYMCYFKRNDYTIACPTLRLDLATSYGSSTTKSYFISPTRGLLWKSYIQNYVMRDQLSTQLYSGELFKLYQEEWNDHDQPFSIGSKIMYPIECANTADPNDATKRYNSMYGLTNYEYIDPMHIDTEKGWRIWTVRKVGEAS